MLFSRYARIAAIAALAAGCTLSGAQTRPAPRAPAAAPTTPAVQTPTVSVTTPVRTTTIAMTPTAAPPAPTVAQRVRALGPVIDPPATAAIYAPRVVEREPYVGIKVTRDIAYGPGARNLLDLFVPPGSPTAARPVFMFVHGGAFTRGDRRGAGSPFYDNVMLWAARNGMIGVNLTYRLAPASQWPAGSQDVASAVNWVHANVAKHGGDPRRVFLMGHSAGAVHVAGYVGQPGFHLVPGSGLAGALMLSGLYDLGSLTASPAERAYFGDDPAAYAQRTPLPGLLNSRVPMWIGVAELDPPHFRAQASLANDALCKVGRCPWMVDFAGQSHMSEIYSIHTDERAISDALLRFVQRH